MAHLPPINIFCSKWIKIKIPICKGGNKKKEKENKKIKLNSCSFQIEHFFAQTQNKKKIDVPILKFNVNFQFDPSFCLLFLVPIKFLQRVFSFLKNILK